VTDAITIKKFLNLDRFGELAGKPNENFLNAELFVKAFLRPCEAMRSNVGLLMFEFSRFWPTDYQHGRDFIADLDKSLGQLPKGWPYGVELRNQNWLSPDYFECLSRHHVAHVFNSWTEMPPIGEQVELGWTFAANFTVSRALLKPGRRYSDAVKQFQPYDRVQEPLPSLRKDLVRLVSEAHRRRVEAFILANNRAEGNAPGTIRAVARMWLEGDGAGTS